MDIGATIKQMILEAGAYKAAVLRKEDIVLSAEFRSICRSGQCGKYGRCWMCPPDIEEIDVLMHRVKEYSGAVLYQTVSDIDDSFDMEGMLKAGHNHAALSQKIRHRLNGNVSNTLLHLSCGGCRLCDHCARETDEPCRFPTLAMPSLEGYGVDVYRTSLRTDLKYINGENTVTFFGMVLYREVENG